MASKIFIFLGLAASCLAQISKPEADFDVDNPIYRPCAFDDYKCIGDVLEHNSACKRPVNGSIPEELTIAQLGRRYKMPYFNATYADSDVTIRNLNLCSVKEFFINPVTDKAVLGIDCPNLDLEGERTLLKHRSQREDDVYSYRAKGFYPLTRITVLFPSAKNMNMHGVNTLKELIGKPELAFQSLDPDHPTSEIIANDLTPINVFEVESIYYRNLFFQLHFVQKMLCDYGLPY